MTGLTFFKDCANIVDTGRTHCSLTFELVAHCLLCPLFMDRWKKKKKKKNIFRLNTCIILNDLLLTPISHASRIFVSVRGLCKRQSDSSRSLGRMWVVSGWTDGVLHFYHSNLTMFTYESEILKKRISLYPIWRLWRSENCTRRSLTVPPR